MKKTIFVLESFDGVEIARAEFLRRRMRREIDKSKKSNIKCEHCIHWDKSKPCVVFGETHKNMCSAKNEYKAYWNRCKVFEWNS